MVILGRDDIRKSERLENVDIRHNFFELHTADTTGKGRLFQISNGSYDVTIDHNTGLQDRNIIWAYSRAHDLFSFTNNLIRHNTCDSHDNNCGIAGDRTQVGDPTITKYFPGGVFVQNVMFTGGYPSDYTKTQLCSIDGFPADVAFDADGSLTADSPYLEKGVTDTTCNDDSRDIGADMATVNTTAGGAVQGPAYGSTSDPVDTVIADAGGSDPRSEVVATVEVAFDSLAR